MDIRDIAAASGYGVGTVSRVINDQPNVSERARKRILAVMSECGYEPNTNARYLKMRSQTPVAAFVMGVGNRLFGDILGHVQALLAEKDEEVVVTYLDDDAREVLDAIEYQRARRPKAMVFLGGEPRSFEESFSQIEVPSVLVTNSAEGLGFPNLSSVTIDNAAAARDAVEYLWARGHRRIGVLGGSRHPGKVAALRLAGVEEALRAHGAELDYERDYEPCGYTEEEGYAALGRLLGHAGDLTAVFCLGDVIAFGALRAAHDRGLDVPGDLSLVGFDGTALARFSIPRITTVRQDSALLSKSCVEVLLETLEHGAEAQHVVVPYELLEQESVRQL